MTTNPTTAGDAGPADDLEVAQVAYINELLRLEQNGERCLTEIGPYSLLLTISALQLALRHPGMSGNVRTTLLRQIEHWRKPFDGTPGAELIDRGFDTGNDVPVPGPAAPAPAPAYWACERCSIEWDAHAYQRPPACPHCHGPITATAGLTG